MNKCGEVVRVSSNKSNTYYKHFYFIFTVKKNNHVTYE